MKSAGLARWELSLPRGKRSESLSIRPAHVLQPIWRSVGLTTSRMMARQDVQDENQKDDEEEEENQEPEVEEEEEEDEDKEEEDERKLMAEASSRAKERVQAELKKFRQAAIKGNRWALMKMTRSPHSPQYVKTLIEASDGNLAESRSSVLVVNPPAAFEKQLGPAEAAAVPGQAVRLHTRGHASILGGLVWNYSWPLVNVLLGTTPRGWQVFLQSPYDTTTILTFINGKQFYLRRIEFTSPSENSLDGESFDMEMQLVHNAAADGQLLVTSVFLKVGLVEGNEYLNTFWPQFPSTVSEDGVQAEIANPFYALPGDRSLYAFNGSSTVPPCGTDTIWMVFKQPLMISRAQRDLYRAALNLSAPTGFLRFGSAPSGVVQPWNTDLGMNTRLPQPQGVRQVAFFPMSNPPSQMSFDLTSGHFWGFFGIGLLLLSVSVGLLALLCLLCSGGARAKGRARSKEVFHRSEETDEDRQPLYRTPEPGPAPTQMHRMPMPTQPQWPANAGRGMMTRPQIPQMSGARAPAMTQPMNFVVAVEALIFREVNEGMRCERQKDCNLMVHV
eukprot:s2412_g3.t1